MAKRKVALPAENRLLDSEIKNLRPPEKGNKVYYDGALAGFGLRVTSAGARSWVFNYRSHGIERRITIGSLEAWKLKDARKYAEELRRQVDAGGDPMGDRHAERAAPTVNDLADRFEAEHLPRKRASTQDEYKRLLRVHIRPVLGNKRVVDLRHADIEALHQKIAAAAPYAANRAVAVLSKMFSLAVKWEIRDDNPAKGVERAPEEKRERYLTPAEIAKLGEVLAVHPEKVSANAVRLMLLTGARKGETLAARWADFDLETGVWVKPAATTKTAKLHRVPLSAPALALLVEMKTEHDAENARRVRDGMTPIAHVFPSLGGEPLGDLKHFWAAVTRKAGLGEMVEKRDEAGKVVKDKDGNPALVWKANARVHDTRHTYASILASSGLSLPVIGALLGHTQAATTARYAHLLDDPLRKATETAGAIIAGAGKPGADVSGMDGRRQA